MSASSNVTVPVGSSFTPSSLQFNVALMLASMRGPQAVKHQCKLVEAPESR